MMMKIRQRMTATWKLAVDPMPWIRVVELSVCTKPYRVVHLLCVRTTDLDEVMEWYKLLKHITDVLICDDRQCGVPAQAKLSRFIPTQCRAVCVEAILLTVHWVARTDCWYDIYHVEQNQYTSCKTYVFIDTHRIVSIITIIINFIIIKIIIKLITKNALIWRTLSRKCYTVYSYTVRIMA